jgi:predicted nuclease of predicted toxin-antitoxin system
LLLDMNISPRLAARLRESGHDALHLRDQGLQRLSDEAVFEKARDERRILVSSTADSGDLASAAGRAGASVILLRTTSARPVRILPRLEAVLSTSGGALARGAVISVGDATHRIRAF